jgi:hypothetical protein
MHTLAVRERFEHGPKLVVSDRGDPDVDDDGRRTGGA